MKNKVFLIIINLGTLYLLFFLTGCGSITREEKDIYTITERDTTYQHFVRNSPVNQNQGTVFPSSREILSERNIVQRDSTIIRTYPNFIRLGLFETIGTIGGDFNHGIGTGLFGVFINKNASVYYRGNSGHVFNGGIYRFGISEWRLRWFQDAKNWTIGTSIFEAILPDARSEKYLMSTMPIYLRKRFFLREEIPYIAFTPAVGIGLLPSQYFNLSGSLDIGSIGGLNVRAYLGYAFGYNGKWVPQVANNDYTHKEQTVYFPYFGIGMSMLDFLNRVPETYIEWKDHEHSSWQIGLLNFSLLTSNASKSIFTGSSKTFFKGIDFEFARTNVAIPILNNSFYVGSSLLTMKYLSDAEWTISALPLRVGYWTTLLKDELSATPYIEVGYYPYYYFNIAGEVNLRISELINFGLKGGFIRGEAETSEIFSSNTHKFLFSKFYLGITFRILDRIFSSKELRYNRPDLPKQPKQYE
ncbi:MAG TPA: hypothetical protein P5216_01245 [Bacteroidota bacterium]|nr:hypothetical protein [Bacteroidota bacterium]